MTVGPDELQKRFTHHPPKGDEDVLFFVRMRNEAWRLAELVVEGTEHSREQALALTKIEEAVMWANAARARRG